MLNVRRALRSLRNQKEAMSKLSSLIEAHKAIVSESLGCARSACENLPIVIFAHFQPEATTFPEGMSYHNHIDVAYKLREANPNRIIMYKEHPASFLFAHEDRLTGVGIARDSKYFEILEALGLLFVGDDIQLKFSESIEVLTIQGTIGMERSLEGLRSFTCVTPWYGNLPGIYKIDDLPNLVGKYRGHPKELAAEELRARFRGRVSIAPYHVGSQLKISRIFAEQFSKNIDSLREHYDGGTKEHLY